MKALPIVGEWGVGSGPPRSAPELRVAPDGTTPHSPRLATLVRAALLADVPGLEALQAPYVATGDLLPRSNYDLCRHIKEWVVVAEPADGAIVGCGALKIYSGELAGDHGLARVFALTRKPEFFLRLGFVPAEKEQFPEKVWADCARCPRQNCCDEIAVALRL